MFHVASVSASRRPSSALLAPFGILITAGALLAIDLRRPAVVLADATPFPDLDVDGLPDCQERILGTCASLVDTDRDQYSDTEEFARGSSPTYPQIVPQGNGLHLGLTARGESDGLHALVGVYLPESDFGSVNLRVGMLTGTRIAYFPETLVEARGNIEFVSADQPSAAIALVDFRFPRALIDRTGHLTLFATVGHVGSGTVESVGVIELFNIGGVIALAAPDPFTLPALSLTGGGGAASSGGTVYRPLTPGGDDTPRGWTTEELCFQESQPVGVSGSIVTNEIVTAECQTGWDGSCPATCSSSVGSTYTSIDPAALIGG
jgi:hypothetical protein